MLAEKSIFCANANEMLCIVQDCIPCTNLLLFFRDHLETASNRERVFKKRFSPPLYRTVYYKQNVVPEKLCLTNRNDEESSSFSILTFTLLSFGLNSCLQMAKLLCNSVDADWRGINHFRIGRYKDVIKTGILG